ncbi:MAG: alcohol dehydrogenase, partial [Verrucomicrobiota bacterium]|nr:alcohol dehydrogenase [Verrucomicrobiota bacterium]
MKHLLLLLALSLPLMAEDWPQFLGPRRNGTYHGKDLAAQWPADGPKVLWKKKVGSGWSSAVTTGGRVVHFHRDGQQEVIECSDATSGKTLWKHTYAANYVDRFGKDNG